MSTFTERGTHRELREHVAALHAELTRYGLVTWTAATSPAGCPARTCSSSRAAGSSTTS